MQRLLLPVLVSFIALLPAALPRAQTAAPPALAANAPTAAQPRATTTPTASQVARSLDAMPLHFEGPSSGSGAPYDFMARGPGYTAFLTSTAAVLVLRVPDSQADQATPTPTATPGHAPTPTHPLPPLRGKFLPFAGTGGAAARAGAPETRWALWLTLDGANPKAQATGEDLLPGTVNEFIGNDSAMWRTNLSTFARVLYHDAYPGIDVAYYGNQGQLEDDFMVAPGADSARIAMRVAGADRMSIDATGELVAHLGKTDVRWRKPTASQATKVGPHAIDVAYHLDASGAVHLQLGAHDRTQPLVIDPGLDYSTYLGGSGDDEGSSIVSDSNGNVYITGSTGSADFPITPGAVQFTCSTCYGGDTDAFVAKLNSDGSAVAYSTFLGGNGNDGGDGIAIDASGNAYIAGTTSSTDYPTTQDAFQPRCGCYVDAFVTELNASGRALAYSTYLGGSDQDWSDGIAVDSAGNAYVTGTTLSTDFPVSPGAIEQICPDTPPYCGAAFVSKLNFSGSALIYSTFLGGIDDGGFGIAVDKTGDAYITGLASSDFPVTSGAFQTIIGGTTNAFVAKVNTTGSALVYSTFLGGSGGDEGSSIALDTAGEVFITGTTQSANFPTTPGSFQATCGDISSSCDFGDTFVSKLNAAGSALDYSTFLGGNGGDRGYGIAVDVVGDAYITGLTDSTNFPTTSGAFQPACDSCSVASNDAFVSKLNAAGSALMSSTYLGGSHDDEGHGVAVDARGSAYVVGTTESTDFPVTPFAFQDACGDGSYCAGNEDAFVTKLPMSAAIAISSPSGAAGALVTVRGSGFARNEIVSLSWNGVASIGSATTDSTGSFSTPVAVPVGVGTGPAPIAATDTSGDAASEIFLVKCFLNMAGSGCASDANNQIVILVPGIFCTVPTPPFCDGIDLTHKESIDTFFPGGAPDSGPLAQALASTLRVSSRNEIPFSYAPYNQSGDTYLNSLTYTETQNHQDFGVSSGNLSQYIEAVQRSFPGVMVNVISHSMGGLITANALQGFELKPKNVRAVAVDSPLRGIAAAAGFAFLSVGRADPAYYDLAPGSIYVTDAMNEQGDPRFFVATNLQDVFVPATGNYVGPSGRPGQAWAGCEGIGNFLGHGAVFASSDGSEAVASELQGSTPPSDYQAYLSGKTLCLPGAGMVVLSPATMLITDPLGREVGYDSATGQIVNQIPGATYTGPGTEPQIIALPSFATGNYQVALTGTGSGTVTFLEGQVVGNRPLAGMVTLPISPGQHQAVAVGVSTSAPPIILVNGRLPAPQVSPQPTSTRGPAPQITPRPTPTGRTPAGQVTPQPTFDAAPVRQAAPSTAGATGTTPTRTRG